MKFKSIFITLFFCYALLINAQTDVDLKNKADSVLAFWNQNEIDPNLISIEEIEGYISYFNSVNNFCSEVIMKLKKSDFLTIKGQHENSIILGLDIIKKFPNGCDSLLLIETYCNLSTNYKELHDFSTTLNILNEGAYIYNPNWGDTKELFNLHSAFGSLYFNSEEFLKARQEFEIALTVAENLDDTKKVQKTLFNISVVMIVLDDKDSARYYLNSSLISAQQLNNPTSIGRVYNTLAALSEDYDTRILYIDSALNIAVKHNSYADIQTYYKNRALAKSYKGFFESAFDDVWVSSNYKDSVYNKQTAESVAEMKQKYEAEKKALIIKNLNLSKLEAELESELHRINETRLFYGSIGLLVFLIILTYQYKQLHKNKNILAERNVQVEKEKERSEELLLNILPYDVAEELKATGESKAKSFDNVTILFTDFKEFTKLTEKMPPEKLVEEINVCFKSFDEIIYKHNIEKIKTIGDAYMAAGGLQTPTISEAKDVVLAALEIQDFMIIRKLDLEHPEETHFEMRVGIHTGPVVAGIVGLKKFQYDIWGDTVNTASRMESSSVVGKVNISDYTYNIIKNDPHFKFENRGAIEVKGKGEIKMWFVSLA